MTRRDSARLPEPVPPPGPSGQLPRGRGGQHPAAAGPGGQAEGGAVGAAAAGCGAAGGAAGGEGSAGPIAEAVPPRGWSNAKHIFFAFFYSFSPRFSFVQFFFQFFLKCIFWGIYIFCAFIL